MTPRRFKHILLPTPNVATGGPEAVYQLRQILDDLGLDARIMAYADPADLRIQDGVISHPPLPPLPAFAHYQPLLTDHFALTPDSLVILPEVRADLAARLPPAAVAVWWLSTYNAFYGGSPLRDEAFRKAFFADSSIMHLCQTSFSRSMLAFFGGPPDLLDLCDYVDDRFTATRPSGPGSDPRIAYNPAKGPELSDAFFAAHPEFEPRPITGMTRDQLLEVFSDTRVFVEFGHNPGKDRMPREAAAAGAIVLYRRKGGSRSIDDAPIDGARYKFPETAIADGRLATSLRLIAADPWTAWNNQAYYRNYLRTEKALMHVQARRIFDL